MIRIRFTDSTTERRALGYMVGRFSFKTFDNGITIVTEAALVHLARKGIPFLVEGPATYEQIIPAVRVPAAASVC